VHTKVFGRRLCAEQALIRNLDECDRLTNHFLTLERIALDLPALLYRYQAAGLRNAGLFFEAAGMDSGTDSFPEDKKRLRHESFVIVDALLSSKFIDDEVMIWPNPH